MRRSLIHYRYPHLALAAAAAVAAAVLAGALVVGDSVRGSLRRLVEERLGAVEAALVSGRLFERELAGRVAAALAAEAGPGTPVAAVAPVLMLRGTAVHGESGARAAGVAVHGVDGRFAELFPEAPPLDLERRPGQLFPPVLLGRTLAGELGAEPGDEVLLSFERSADVPAETLVGRRDAAAAVATLRLSVAEVLPDGGPGGFALEAGQAAPRNAFVELGRLDRAVEAGGRVNALLAAAAGAGEVGGRDLSSGPSLDRGDSTRDPDRELDRDLDRMLERALAAAVTAGDLGFTVRRGAGGDAVVESREFVLAPPLAAAAEAAARALGARALPVSTYLANRVEKLGEGAAPRRAFPYSTVAALDPDTAGNGGLSLVDGAPAPALAPGEILLNRWAAEDLEAAPGDEVELTYFTVGPRDALGTATARFRVRGVTAVDGLGADPTLTPAFPGIEEADTMADWDPPFPVDLAAIRPRDEAYWEAYRATPKAFVSPADGRRLWASRFGELTSMRVAPPPGADPAAFAERLSEELPRHLAPAELGLSFRPVRADGLRAAEGATDFAGLFLGFSLFLIASAALLVALLFRLAVEQRAREVGLLLAVGYRLAAVRRRLLLEGGVVAAAALPLGLAGAVGYAALMLAGLRTWWLPAVGTPVLFLHVEVSTLLLGGGASLAVVLAAVALAVGRLHRVPPPALLAGAVAAGGDPAAAERSGRRAALLARAAAVGALAVAAGAFATGRASSPVLAFATGALLLVAALAAFAAWTAGGGRGRDSALGAGTRLPALVLGARSSLRNPGRSRLAVALVACATFLLVVVGANRGAQGPPVTDRAGGAGGFTLIAESAVPLVQDLNRPEGRFELGLSEAAAAGLDGVTAVPLRLLPGEDASCLNLYRPERPRVLGVPRELIERGGFAFAETLTGAEEPWRLLERELPPVGGEPVIPAFGDEASVRWILHRELGEDLSYEDDSGRTVRLRLVGLLRQSVFQSELLVAEEAFLRHFGSRTGSSVFLLDPPLERADELAELLEADLARLGFRVEPTAERLARFRAVELTYLATFQTLGGLGLLLGTLGLALALLRNVLERRGELATLRAFGFRRGQLSAMVVAENAFLLAVGLAAGTLAGLAAAAPHLLATGGRLPWPSLAATLLAVFATGLAASAAAVAGVLRVPLLPALKEEG